MLRRVALALLLCGCSEPEEVQIFNRFRDAVCAGDFQAAIAQLDRKAMRTGALQIIRNTTPMTANVSDDQMWAAADGIVLGVVEEIGRGEASRYCHAVDVQRLAPLVVGWTDPVSGKAFGAQIGSGDKFTAISLK